MKKLIALGVFVLLIAFLAGTCPDKQDHNEALSEGITELLSKNAGINADFITNNPEAQKLIRSVGDNMVFVSNYFIFSLGKIQFDGEEQVVSLGIAGHVFTFNDKIVQESISLLEKAKNQFDDWSNN
jgi:hypothetical protein